MVNKGFLCKVFALSCLIGMIVNEGCFSQQFSVGVKAGALLNWAHFGEKDDRSKFGSKPIPGYAGGFVISFPLKNKFSFLVEGGYSKKGRIVTHPENSTTDWLNTATYNMLDGSMALRKSYTFKFRKNIPAQWFFNIGPEINYVLNGKGNIKVGGPGYNYTILYRNDSIQDYHYMNYINANRWLFALDIGIGCKFPLHKNQSFTIELRFISGHTYLGKKGTGISATNQGHSFINILGYEDTLQTNLKSLNFSLTYVFDSDRQKRRMGKSTISQKK
ncbi:MAG TPA: porin family protein [Cyclobacteriaceae bacterium]|jgi:hypothetical protein|nr:porin family protein [Cyclobacteriaceae bacterium]